MMGRRGFAIQALRQIGDGKTFLTIQQRQRVPMGFRQLLRQLAMAFATAATTGDFGVAHSAEL